ncbi:hypothetical protein SSBR45G_38460 [Bradyrhizobium sp. SSBR45G]|uniref:hypothetical protein n=1 Tax=unclassified Bradyrhizobium TaxID=2631580 RepID=UPI0023428E8D|nr:MULTISPECIES: hypothetical protein [unclassified Bradyrhizobium]GLH78937.1 hypothetical protein SSBR45G_38460 [Bradyrhizobium sp. SSBR45G]GLH85260.1 hypothetical protein SSBR45R_27200 [Bradyrhizobium sp. SSBR45R]
MFSWLAALFEEAFRSFWSWSVATDRRDDPVYKNNVRELIERNRRFEDARE